MTLLAAPDCTNTHAQSPMNNAFFTYTVQNKANSIQFAQQSLCSPKISMLCKAIRHSYLKGCPNLAAAGITKYLNPSLATAKRHMKRLQMGIHSMQHKDAPELFAAPTPTNPGLCNDQSTNSLLSDVQPFSATKANVIEENATSLDANIFCFAAFADKQTGILYNDLTGTFPFMSHKGIICFLIIYHYKMNPTLAPLLGMLDVGLSKRGSKQQTPTCRPDMLPTC
jgi:hypothetical protein